MVKNHLKRIATPKTWSILRKKSRFVTRPNPGAHSYAHCYSINTLFKEILEIASTKKEVKRILHDQEVLVDGKKRHDERYNVGFMDSVALPKTKKAYRVIFGSLGKLTAIEIPYAEANSKLVRIKDKHAVKKGKMQITTTDGRSLILDKNGYNTGDSLLITLPQQEVKEHISMKQGVQVVIFKGKYAGTTGVLDNIEENEVVVKAKDKTFHTKKSYAYVTGTTKPIIKCTP